MFIMGLRGLQMGDCWDVQFANYPLEPSLEKDFTACGGHLSPMSLQAP